MPLTYFYSICLVLYNICGSMEWELEVSSSLVTPKPANQLQFNLLFYVRYQTYNTRYQTYDNTVIHARSTTTIIKTGFIYWNEALLVCV